MSMGVGMLLVYLVFRQLTEIVLKMTGENCAVVNCGTNCRTKGIGIFNLPSKKLHSAWQNKWLNEITKQEQSTHILKIS